MGEITELPENNLTIVSKCIKDFADFRPEILSLGLREIFKTSCSRMEEIKKKYTSKPDCANFWA